MSNIEGFNKENYQFHFPVVGYFEGDRIIFIVDPSVDVNGGKYIFDISKEDWVTINDSSNEVWKELNNLDLQIAAELVFRLSVIGKEDPFL